MIQAIKDELAAKPATYDTLSNAEVVVLLKLISNPINRASISGSELLGLADATEYTGLSDIKRDNWLSLCGVDSIDPFGSAAQLVQDIWTGKPKTIAALVAARTETKTPFINVQENEVLIARAQ